jgi:hypothetical protein
MINAKVVSNFQGQITELSRVTGFPLMTVFKEEMRLFLELGVSKFTPPFSAKRVSGVRFVDRGMRTILRDTNYAAQSMDPATVRFEALKKALEANDTFAVSELFRKVPRLNAKFGNRTVLAHGFDALHRRAQNKRGRINRDQRNFYTNHAEKVKRQERLSDGVGIAKASWLPALKLAGGKPQPKYITRHGGKWGDATVSPGGGLNFDDPTGAYFEAVADGIKIPDYPRRVEAAMKARERTLILKVKRLIDGKAVNLGKNMTRLIKL